MKIFILVLASSLLLFSCSEKYPHWNIEKTIDIGGGPIGIDVDGSSVWISDGNNNLLNRYDQDWNLVESIEGFERPMHIAVEGSLVFVPEYGSDQIIKVANGEKDSLIVDIDLNAPAGVDVSGDQVAIADFYSNSVVYGSNNDWKVLGEKGKEAGQFHYPTDVQIFNDTLYVADAYNHRIQIMTTSGNHISTIGVDQDMNATTGIHVTDKAIFATDLENDRVIVFDRQGKVLDMLVEGFDKPTDLMVHDGQLWVLNYGSGEVVVLNQGE